MIPQNDNGHAANTISDEGKLQIPITEYQLPHGKQVEGFLFIDPKYKAAVDHTQELLKIPNTRFECETLTTGDAHFTFSHLEIGVDLANLLIFTYQQPQWEQLLTNWILSLKLDDIQKQIDTLNAEDAGDDDED